MILQCMTPLLARSGLLDAIRAIGVPIITLEGDANGAPHAEPAAYAQKFSGKYEHRTVTGGIGHNLPQEAPQAFAQAVVDVSSI
jgi:pimeloyl-ACP methyl ester carboxylesterase